MPIPEDVLQLVPTGCHANWNKKTQSYYVFKSRYVYDPAKKRGREIRTSVGVIKDGKFEFSKNYLNEQTIQELKKNHPKIVESAKQSKQNMSSQVQASIVDARQKGKVVYPLDYVYLVSFLSALSGRTSCVQIADFWKNNGPALREIFADFPKEDISHDTVRRLLMLVDPSQFQDLYQRLIAPLVYQFHQRVVAVDGQAVRATKTPKIKTGKYILSFYDTDNGIVLGQKLIGEKENEITHAADLAKGFDLDGTVVTTDALNTQAKLAQTLIEKGADYCMAVKENHKDLYYDLQLAFVDITETRTRKHVTKDFAHGRIEDREYFVLPASALGSKHLNKWKGLDEGSIVKTTTKTWKKSTGKATDLDRYYISSLHFDDPHISEQIARAVRGHWGIENQLHYVLDVDFHQDLTQCKNANYVQNRTLLNKSALSLIRRQQSLEVEKTGKEPMSVKRYMDKFTVLQNALEALPGTLKND